MKLVRSRIIIAVAAIWLVAGLIIWMAKRATPTAVSVAAYIQEHPLDGLSSERRLRIIDEVSDQMNRLDYDQRQKFRDSGGSVRFFGQMTAEERSRFLDATLPEGFKQMMESFNRMNPDKRKAFVSKALERMRRDQGNRPPPNLDDPNLKKIVDQGMRSFFNDASAETKLDLAPLIEEMQRGMQGFGR